jgi:3-deoxy-7-phosphoheptulonate synthase
MEGATSTRTAGIGVERPADRSLLTPDAVQRALPASDAALAAVCAGRESLRALLRGSDPRMLAIVGPCSVHDPEAALDYAHRLARLAESLSSELLVLMRVFVEKPRTHVGWKGLVNDPTLDGSCDVGLGLATARQLMLRINELGLPCATELLEPLTAPYLRDLVAWGGVGARTSESPVHRQLASDAPHPVGFKNGTGGDIDVAIHAMRAARSEQVFPTLSDAGRCVVRRAPGNPDVHLVLRGGRRGTNHDEVSIASAAKRAAHDGVARPVLVDCSHDNSLRDHRNQSRVCRSVGAAFRGGAPGLLGVMLESNLEAGRQDAIAGRKLLYGVSITDACIGWTETADLLGELASVMRSSR